MGDENELFAVGLREDRNLSPLWVQPGLFLPCIPNLTSGALGPLVTGDQWPPVGCGGAGTGRGGGGG